MKQGKVKERTARKGTNHILMGRLCVVHAYAFWESYLREEVRLAFEAGETPKHDLWGDLRIMRHAILHNKGIAGPDFRRMKLLKWFKPGEPVNLDFENMKFIFEQMANFRNNLHFLSLQPSTGILPSQNS